MSTHIDASLVVPFKIGVSVLWTALGTTSVYLLSLCIWRLWFSPLAKFPGPKLAAISPYYEAYYEIFHGYGGQFPFHINELHKQYGPIVRINPWEVHINDPEFYETVYTSTERYDKMAAYQHRLSAPHASFSTPEHDLHRARRSAMAPFFSKRKVINYTPFIKKLVDRICYRITNEYKNTGKMLNLSNVWACYTADTITNYAFDRQYNFIDKPDFEGRFTRDVRGIADYSQWMTFFPFLVTLGKVLPPSFVAWLIPASKSLLDFRAEVRKLITRVKDEKFVPPPTDEHDTVFYELLRSNLSPEEKSVERLESEAMSIIGAGIETTRWSLSIACYHILANPHMLKKVRKELLVAMPDPKVIPEVPELEKLPYLGGCVEEAVRLTYGVPSRSPRVPWHKPFVYGDWVIPPGVPVSLQTLTMHHDENVFPDSHEFRPERWLNDIKGPDGKKQLSRYMVSFGKGSRMCLGMQMAYAEIFLGLSAVLRRFDFELYETDRTAVDLARVMIGPQPKPGTQGVRVVLK
ncbi:MAG: hypothetical protein M1828_005642 [Chrysothrix sp. TS-e1954]|nr:MAG: hypothetical protein M1828_005642 [Chrysothrix sp. TS-e1954]